MRVVNSGTATLEIALALAGIGPEAEVITTPLSWVATANVILRAGARPVFVDVEPATRNIDLDLVEAAITPRTRALMPVDLAGLPVDRDRLYAIAAAPRPARDRRRRASHGRRAGAAGASAALAIWSRSASTPTRT